MTAALCGSRLPDPKLETTGRSRRGGFLHNAAALPAKFDLHFDNGTRHCIVVWRRLYWLGVKFKSAP
jgi:hypothetical protein